MKGSRLRLRHAPISGRHQRRPQPLSTQYDRLVEVDKLDLACQLHFCDGKREAAAAQHCRREALASKSSELFDDAGECAIGEIEAAVGVGVIVTTFALEDAGKP